MGAAPNPPPGMPTAVFYQERFRRTLKARGVEPGPGWAKWTPPPAPKPAERRATAPAEPAAPSALSAIGPRPKPIRKAKAKR